MTIPPAYEKQIRSIVKNVADIRKFTEVTAIYFQESTSFLKSMMSKAGVEYNPDIENLRLPFQDEALSYAITHLITQLLQYEKSADYIRLKLSEFDQRTAKQLASVFNREESDGTRNKVILEVVEGIEELSEEKHNLIELTKDIEKTIQLLETRLSAFFN